MLLGLLRNVGRDKRGTGGASDVDLLSPSAPAPAALPLKTTRSTQDQEPSLLRLFDWDRERQMSANALDMLREERRRTAMDLHDNVMPSLLSARIGAEACREQIPPGSVSAVRILDQVEEALSRTMMHVGDCISELRSGSKKSEPLSDLAETIVREMSRAHGPKSDFVLEGNCAPLPPVVSLSLLAIVREGVANVLKHAAAGSFTVGLSYSEEAVELVLADDGKGFDVHEALDGAEEKGACGLSNIASRVRELSGTLSIRSARGEGTELRISLPRDENGERWIRYEQS